MAAGFSTSISSLLLLLCFYISFSEARDHLVGGKTDSWKIPSSQSVSLNHWAQSSRFLIGDSLVWKYNASIDSVLQVTKRDYWTCNTSNPIAAHNDGNTKVKLEHSGPYYFISGANGHCENGQKLIVIVLSEKHRIFMGVSPEPSPVVVEISQAPAPAPASGGAAESLKQSFLMMVSMGAFLELFFLL